MVAYQIESKYKHKRKLLSELEKDPNRNCIFIDNMFYLITKDSHYLKPTYSSLRNALSSLKDHVEVFNVNNIAMPKIGCGADKLEWCKVERIIMAKFSSIENLTIKVCELQ